MGENETFLLQVDSKGTAEIPLLCICPSKTLVQKDTCTIVLGSIIYYSQDMETT